MNKSKFIAHYISKGLKIKDIELLLQKITGLTASQLFLSDNIDEQHIILIEENFSQLIDGVPIEYLLNNANFYGLDFYVDNRVLIPRNDTEVMVDEVLNTISQILNSHQGETSVTLIDVGTGSSCIPIAIMENSQHIHNTYIIDIEEKALEVGQKNINKHGFQNKTSLIHSSLLDEFLIDHQDLNFSPYIIITANLPYIKEGDHENMNESVINHEPASALYGGQITGFELYEILINQSIQLKRMYHFKKLILFIEIGFDQFEYSQKFLNTKDLTAKYYKDNHNKYRCIKIDL